MTSDGPGSALEKLRDYYDHEELVCPDCGYEDEGGSWDSETDGEVVEYTHECPECGAVREHTLEVGDE
ncbi:HVO_0649 family zinc finger protein [Halosimplex halobium]|uniref:HVO_0649 family zinc finger protein n=1 Tax=Halosimplex halobium TaxID=3396618 RepID=UPI003F5709E6